MSKLDSISGRSIRKPTVAIADKDVHEILLTIRKQRMEWKPVKRSARLGDRVAITYEISRHNQIIESHETSQRNLVLGSGNFHKGLERRFLVGAKSGDIIKAGAQLPRDYSTTELAGKRVVYTVSVIEVCKPVLPALNSQFAKELGLSKGGTKTLHKQVRAIMQREVDSTIKRIVRAQVIDILLEEYPLVIDKDEILRESKRRHQIYLKNSDANTSKLAADQIRSFAKLYVIMKDIVRTDKLEIPPKRSETTITAMGLRREDPEAAIKSYLKDFEELLRIQSEILEDQVIEHVLSYVDVQSIPINYRKFKSTENHFWQTRDWPAWPVIQLRADNKCAFCALSKCCRYVTQKIPTPRSKVDFSHLLWQVSHENVSVFKDSDGWHLMFETTCSHLQPGGGCGIYQNRPQICRDYSVKNCEFDGKAEDDWELSFSNHESLLGYCKQRFRRWV